MAQVGEAEGEFRGNSYRDDTELKAWLAKRPTEAALEPDLPIINPHHHFWDSRERGTYLLPELLADIGGGHNIVSSSSNAASCTARTARGRWRPSAKRNSSTASPP
jgi:L-fuconolactonase